MSNKELKPCPFCGGEADIEGIPQLYYISCKNCYADMRAYGSKAEAINAWNTRNYLEKQDSSISEKIIDAIIENKLFSVINPHTNKEIEETLVVWAGNANEIIETVICEQSCKEEKEKQK